MGIPCRAMGGFAARAVQVTWACCTTRTSFACFARRWAWARRERIDRTLLNRILCGQKPPTDKIIRALKLCNDYALHDDGVR
jgi:hypothetical protein